MRLDQSFSISPNVVAKAVGNETVILALESGQYFGLDEIGAHIWRLLSDGKTLGEIHDLMLVEYEVAEETLRDDVRALVQDLISHNLIAGR